MVPQVLLKRESKGEYSAEAFAGLRSNRRSLLELCEDLQLARLGLVDPSALRSALLNPGPEPRHLKPIESTLACEFWLRSVAAGRKARAGDRRR